MRYLFGTVYRWGFGHHPNPGQIETAGGLGLGTVASRRVNQTLVGNEAGMSTYYAAWKVYEQQQQQTVLILMGLGAGLGLGWLLIDRLPNRLQQVTRWVYLASLLGVAAYSIFGG